MEGGVSGCSSHPPLPGPCRGQRVRVARAEVPWVRARSDSIGGYYRHRYWCRNSGVFAGYPAGRVGLPRLFRSGDWCPHFGAVAVLLALVALGRYRRWCTRVLLVQQLESHSAAARYG